MYYSEVEFVGQVVELDAGPQSLIEAQNPQKLHFRSQSYRVATNTLASQSVGMNDLLIGTRVSSLKSIWITCSPENALEKKDASVNPNLGQGTYFVLAGQNLPQRTLNPSAHPADCFSELQKSFGALSMANFNGAIPKESYYRSLLAYGLMSVLNTTLANVETFVNSPFFVLGVNTAIVAHRGGLLSGTNINTAPSFFRAQIDTAISANSHTLFFVSFFDEILEFDVLAHTCVAKF